MIIPSMKGPNQTRTQKRMKNEEKSDRKMGKMKREHGD